MSFKQFSTNQSPTKPDTSVKPSEKLPEDKHKGMPEDEKQSSAKP